MFLICRNHLKTVAENVGIGHVLFSPSASTSGRSCRIFTRPGFRSSIEYTNIYQGGKVKRWRDWNDLNIKSEPKIKIRRLAANRSIVFRVVLSNTTADKLNEDFEGFIRLLNKRVYDGTIAYYIDENGENKTDNKGNKIDIILNNYDFNDNKYYGQNPNMAILDITFNGAVYYADEEISEKLLLAGYVKPEVDSVTT